MQRLTLLVILMAMLSVTQGIAQETWKVTSGPQDGDIRVLVRDSSGNIYAMHTNSIARFRSTDDGLTWLRMSDTTGANGIAGSATRNGMVYFIGSTGATTYALYNSTDAGRSWAIARSADAGQAVATTRDGIVLFAHGKQLERYGQDGSAWKDISIPSSSSTSKDGSVQALAIASSGYIYAATLAGIYRSSDNGSNWVATYEGMGKRAMRAMAVGTNGELYAVGDTLVYRSTDDGMHWQQSSITLGAASVIGVGRNGDVLIGSTDGNMYRSTDHGMTWSQKVVTGLFTRSLLQASDGSWLAGSAINGLFRSTDNGITWIVSNTGMNASTINALTVAPGGRIYSGMQGGYGGIVYSSSDGGDTWEGLRPIPAPGPIWCLCALPNGYVLAGTERTGIYRTTDHGTSWAQANNGLQNLFVRSFLVKPNGDVLAGTEKGVYLSTDMGVTWKITALNNAQFWSLARHPDGTLLAGASSGPIHYSTDDGATWTMVKGFGATSDIQALGVAIDGSVYAASFNTGVFRSTDVGRTWMKVLNSTFATMAILTAPNGAVYVGGNGGGVHKTTDDGATWNLDTSGAGRKLFVGAFALDSNGYIYAGSSGFGVIRSLGPASSVEMANERGRVSEKSMTISIVPNTITSSATLRLGLSQMAHVTLYIYDSDGREIEKVVDEDLVAGQHSFDCNVERLPSGRYRCVVIADGAIASQSFIVIR
jgi:photosystem II stability/assembly factor-like uncharacterized protein